MRKLLNLAMKTWLYLPQNRKETNRIIRIHRKDEKQNNRLNNVGLELQRLTLIFIWLQVRCPNSQLLLDFMVTNGLLSFQPLYFTIPTFTFKHNGTICFWIVQSVSELKFSLIPTFMQTAKEFFFQHKVQYEKYFRFHVCHVTM